MGTVGYIKNDKLETASMKPLCSLKSSLLRSSLLAFRDDNELYAGFHIQSPRLQSINYLEFHIRYRIHASRCTYRMWNVSGQERSHSFHLLLFKNNPVSVFFKRPSECFDCKSGLNRPQKERDFWGRKYRSLHVSRAFVCLNFFQPYWFDFLNLDGSDEPERKTFKAKSARSVVRDH